ncbi:hypothetical protein SKAU_G00389080 [Synaphobranchus kaupii]|uniref:Uncharacterized protein n=1 Tax=Synaphobranchus kaupii TaxID=118154 RepID=A0A9Q1IDF7_SYNKA|nr:hypothetical protein SKAU_G00389080 [Synaphobranchus kaupii]
MSTKPKTHKAMSDSKWMSRLRKFASTGVWPASEGNRPAPRQKKWHDLYQRIQTQDPPTPASVSSAAVMHPPEPCPTVNCSFRVFHPARPSTSSTSPFVVGDFATRGPQMDFVPNQSGGQRQTGAA